MRFVDTAGIRNVALVGHTGAGKTQLACALLFDSGAVNRFGRVDDGTAVTDFDEEAVARKHTLSASPAYFEWQQCKVNLLDTPGAGNFVSDARAALRIVDAAIVVVDAVAGVQVSTEKVWETAAELALPRLIVCHRLDRDRASLSRTMESLRGSFGRGCVPVQLPIGEEKTFHGVIDLVTMRAATFAPDGSGKMITGAIPDALAADAAAAREAMIEAVVEADEGLMDAFFNAGTLTQQELTDGLSRSIRAGTLFPVFCASGLHQIGIQPIADAIVSYAPSPAERPFPVVGPGGEATTLAADSAGPLGLWVWKTIADQFAGRITLFRVLSGTARPDVTVRNLTRDHDERIGHLLLLQGKTQTHAPAIAAGDLGAVAKLRDSHTGDTLGDRAFAANIPPLEFPESVLAYAIVPKSRSDEDKIGPAIQRLREEDPSIGYTRDAQTHDLLLSGQGQQHIEVTVAKLRRRFGVEVALKPPHIPYRETITAVVDAHGRHKKQTGGHGQFGDCRIRMEPLPRGAGFEFVDEIFGGAIPRQFIPAVEKGLHGASERGFLAGYPVVDVRVALTDGAYHDVDSNELSFKMAARLAFKDAMSRAHPTLLEPVMTVEIYAPPDCAGDLMGDLSGRRGKIAGMDTRGHSTVIRATVPMAEMLTYEQVLTAQTGGRGAYHMEFSHYDEVPSHLHAKIVAASRAERSGVPDDEE